MAENIDTTPEEDKQGSGIGTAAGTVVGAAAGGVLGAQVAGKPKDLGTKLSAAQTKHDELKTKYDDELAKGKEELLKKPEHKALFEKVEELEKTHKDLHAEYNGKLKSEWLSAYDKATTEEIGKLTLARVEAQKKVLEKLSESEAPAAAKELAIKGVQRSSS
jgi:hypothetical protein